METQQQKRVSNLGFEVLVFGFFGWFQGFFIVVILGIFLNLPQHWNIKVTMQLFCYGPLCRNFILQFHTFVVSNAFVNS